MDQIIVTKHSEVHMKVDAPEGALREMNEYFTFMSPGAKYDKRVEKGWWDGKIRLFKPRERLLYTGLKGDLIEFCDRYGYQFVDKTPIPSRKFTFEEVAEFAKSLNLTNEKGEPLVPHDYQIQAVVDVLNEGYRGIILSPTSSGKSLIIYILTKFLNQKTLIIVPTKLLVRQMAGDFMSYGYDKPITLIMGEKGQKENGIVRDRDNCEKITVSTWQSIYKMPVEWFDQFTTIVGDEAHTFTANSLKTIMENSRKAFARVGTSGTLGEEKVNIMVLKGLFGRIFTTKTTRELMDEGKITPLEITAIRLKYSEEDAKMAAKIKRDYPDEMKYINSHPRRNNFIASLACRLDGNTLVLFRNIEHGKELYDLIRAKTDKKVRLIYGEIKTDERNELRAMMESTDGVIGVCSYKTFATGTNIKNLHNIIFGSAVKAQILVLQAIGRALRKHASKNIAKLYDVGDDMSRGKQFRNHAFRHFLIRLEYYVKEKFPHKIVEVQL